MPHIDKHGFIFDLDGTLLDSLGVWEQIDVDFLTSRGLGVPVDYMHAVSVLSFREAAEYTISRFGFSESPDELMAEWFGMAVHAYGNTVPMKPHALEYLHALKAQGARMAVATSCTPALYQPALQRHGIGDIFDAILCTEQSSNKDRPDIYLETAAMLDREPANCIVFEDLLMAINSAKAAGMTVCAIYDEHSSGQWEQIQQVADAALYDFADAPFHLKK